MSKARNKSKKGAMQQFSVDPSIVDLLKDDSQWTFSTKANGNSDSNKTIMRNIEKVEKYFRSLIFNGLSKTNIASTRVHHDAVHTSAGTSFSDTESIQLSFSKIACRSNQENMLNELCVWFEENSKNIEDTSTKTMENNHNRKWILKPVVETVSQGDTSQQLNVEKGVGMLAASEINLNELIITVPFSLMLTMSNPVALNNHGISSDGETSELVSWLDRWKDNESVQLALLLLHHKFSLGDRKSFFEPYIQALPGAADLSVPLYWSEDVFQFLVGIKSKNSGDGGGMMVLYRQAINSVRASLGLYCRYLAEIQLELQTDATSRKKYMYSWDEFKWGLSVVVTRQNAIPSPASCVSSLVSGSKSGSLALVPVWDMINHDDFAGFVDADAIAPSHSENVETTPPLMTTEFNTSTTCLEFRSPMAFAADSEIHMCYGARSNLHLMLYSGFCNRKNRFETVECAYAMPVDVKGDSLVRVRDAVYRMCKKGMEDNVKQMKLENAAARCGAVGSMELDVNRSIASFNANLRPIPLSTAANCKQLVPYYLLLSMVVMAMQEKAEAAVLMRAQPLSSTELIDHLLNHNYITLAYAIHWAIDTLLSICHHEYGGKARISGAESVCDNARDVYGNTVIYMCEIFRLAKIDILEQHINNLRVLFGAHVKSLLPQDVLHDLQ